MKNYRKTIISAVCAAALTLGALGFSGCSQQKNNSDATEAPTASPTYPLSTDDEAHATGGLKALGIDPASLGINPDVHHDSHKAGFQLEAPAEGDTIAVIHTSEGDITMRLFPEQAPKAVTNFINLSNDGKYNNTTFHRVIKDFIVQGGHSGKDITAVNGVSSYGAEFEDEFCDKLFNLRGAVSMASSSKDSNGSQFFINQTSADVFKKNGGWAAYDDVWSNIKTQLINYKDSNLLSDFVDENGDKFINTEFIPNDVKQLYVDNGGSPNLDGAFNAADRGNTVFGQVIDGMDVVDKIAAVQTDKSDVPLESITITSVEIKTFGEEKATAPTSATQKPTEKATKPTDDSEE